MSLVLTDVTIGDPPERADLRMEDGVIVEIGPHVRGDHPETTMDGRAGRLLPGMIDHHLHVSAWARAQRSVQLPVGGLTGRDGQEIASRGPGPTGWTAVFGLDHHHDIPDTLDLLDQTVNHPVLVVHRTGHAAYLNAAAARLAGRRDRRVRDVGIWWRRALGAIAPADERDIFAGLRDQLLAQGVTAIHDATPYPASAHQRVTQLARWLAPVRMSFMGDPWDPVGGASHGKVTDPLVEPTWVCEQPLAVHAIEPQEIDAAVGIVDGRGRIEHAAICPPGLIERIRQTGCAVCANPGFLAERTEALQPLLRTGDAEFFQPIAQLADAGIEVIFGSDAPVGSPGPWSAIRGACARGPELDAHFPGATWSFDDALRAVTVRPDLVSAPPEHWLGARADLTILARDGPFDQGVPPPVIGTIIGGRMAYIGDLPDEQRRSKRAKEMQCPTPC